MITQISEQLEKAKGGLFIWQSLCHKLSICSSDVVMLIPKKQQNFSLFSLLYSRLFMKSREGHYHLLTTDEVVIKASKYMDLPFQTSHLLTMDECENILAFNSLYMFTDQLIILSSDLPVGRTGFHLVEHGLLTIEEYISLGILQNRIFHRE